MPKGQGRPWWAHSGQWRREVAGPGRGVQPRAPVYQLLGVFSNLRFFPGRGAASWLVLGYLAGECNDFTWQFLPTFCRLRQGDWMWVRDGFLGHSHVVFKFLPASIIGPLLPLSPSKAAVNKDVSYK